MSKNFQSAQRLRKCTPAPRSNRKLTRKHKAQRKLPIFSSISLKGYDHNAIEQLVAQARSRSFRELLVHLAKSRADLILDYYGTLKLISEHLPSAVRPLKSARLKSKTQVGAIRELIRHLFARYEVPECLHDAFVDRDAENIQVFLALGRGLGIRKISNHQLSKKEAHHFVHAPRASGARGAIRFAKARVAGFSEEAARICMRVCARSQLELRALFQDLAKMNLGDELELVLAYCVTKAEADPSFCVQEHNAQSLRLNAQRNFDVGVFKKSGFASLKFEDVEFVELQSAWQLRTEGTRMGHCIYQYRQKAKRGECWIFSMRVKNEQGHLCHVLTLEICARQRRVVQVRGSRNRRASSEEHPALAAFAEANGIVFIAGQC